VIWCPCTLTEVWTYLHFTATWHFHQAMWCHSIMYSLSGLFLNFASLLWNPSGIQENHTDNTIRVSYISTACIHIVPSFDKYRQLTCKLLLTFVRRRGQLFMYNVWYLCPVLKKNSNMLKPLSVKFSENPFRDSEFVTYRQTYRNNKVNGYVFTAFYVAPERDIFS